MTSEELMAGTYQVSVWRFYLLPMWRILRHPFNPDKYLLQVTRWNRLEGKTYYLKPLKGNGDA
jgi:hypothetical protein